MADFPLQFPRDAAASGHVGRAATTAALARGKFGNRAQLSVRAAAPHARARGTLVARILSAAGWPERPVAAVEFACSPVIEMSNGHLDGHRAGRHGCPPSDFRSKKIDAAKRLFRSKRLSIYLLVSLQKNQGRKWSTDDDACSAGAVGPTANPIFGRSPNTETGTLRFGPSKPKGFGFRIVK